MKKQVLGIALLLIAVAATAHATPKAADYRDSMAPCFRWPAVDMDGDGVFDRLDKCVSTPKGCTVDQWGCESDSDGDGVCDGLDRCPATPPGVRVDETGCNPEAERLRRMPVPPSAPREVEQPPPPPPPPPAPVSETEKQLMSGHMRLENVLFETGSARLLPESESSINEAGAALEKFRDLRVEIQGHTDTRGSARFNMALSQARAEAVRAYLLEHFHLRSENLMAKGYGETRPETKERNEEELLRNRRVELHVLNPEVLPKEVKIER